MGLLDKLWDDVAAGPQPEKGLKQLRQKQAGLPEGLESVQGESDPRRISQSISIKKPAAISTTFASSESPISSPSASSPVASSPVMREKDNIWRSVFHPGQNRHMKKMGSAKFDNVSPSAKSPTVYDWLYSGKHKSEYR